MVFLRWIYVTANWLALRREETRLHADEFFFPTFFFGVKSSTWMHVLLGRAFTRTYQVSNQSMVLYLSSALKLDTWFFSSELVAWFHLVWWRFGPWRWLPAMSVWVDMDRGQFVDSEDSRQEQTYCIYLRDTNSFTNILSRKCACPKTSCCCDCVLTRESHSRQRKLSNNSTNPRWSTFNFYEHNRWPQWECASRNALYSIALLHRTRTNVIKD